eukprot:749914-Hanusia_phi.AAC.2
MQTSCPMAVSCAYELLLYRSNACCCRHGMQNGNLECAACGMQRLTEGLERNSWHASVDSSGRCPVATLPSVPCEPAKPGPAGDVALIGRRLGV